MQVISKLNSKLHDYLYKLMAKLNKKNSKIQMCLTHKLSCYKEVHCIEMPAPGPFAQGTRLGMEALPKHPITVMSLKL